MGCGCGKTTTASVRYLHTDSNGRQTTYDSQVQAQAAVIRNGGTWTTVPR